MRSTKLKIAVRPQKEGVEWNEVGGDIQKAVSVMFNFYFTFIILYFLFVSLKKFIKSKHYHDKKA